MTLWALKYIGRGVGFFFYFASMIVMCAAVLYEIFLGGEGLTKIVFFGIVSGVLFGGLVLFITKRMPRVRLVKLQLSGFPDCAWLIVHSKTGEFVDSRINPRILSFLPVFASRYETLAQQYVARCTFRTRYQEQDLQLSAVAAVHLDEGTGLADLVPPFLSEQELVKAVKSAVSQKLEFAFPEIKVGIDKLENQRYLQKIIQEVGSKLEKVPFHITSLSLDLNTAVVE